MPQFFAYTTQLCLMIVAFSIGCAPVTPQLAPQLAGRAVLPAATFAEGPPSGRLLGSEPIHGQSLPFDSQPVQGFSAIHVDDDGTLLVMSDNGYGAIENSADFHLRLYRIRPNFETNEGGAGTLEVLEYIELSDPEEQLPFVITHEFTSDRILTGADLDIESFRVAADGTLWFGDEFGPFLLHTDAEGRVLEPPVSLPDPDNESALLRSPQSPLVEEGSILRLMNAYRAHVWQLGGNSSLVLSPHHHLIADGDAHTFIEARQNEPQTSSEIVDVSSLRRAGFRVIPWTINDSQRMRTLLELGVDGIITDNPHILRQMLESFTCSAETDDCTPPLDDQGLVNSSRLDAQGHRGARGLRPENTLPSFEAALDYLMSTLETDIGVSADGIPLLNHDPYIHPQRCRVAQDAQALDEEGEVFIYRHTAEEIQSTYICDGILEAWPEQRNDRSLSPVSVAFASEAELSDPYVMPTLAQLFEFVAFYERYYRDGVGSNHEDAARRATNASRVRFNMEMKRNPTQLDATINAQDFATTTGEAIARTDLESRTVVQSFDHSTLLELHRRFPDIQTSFLIEDSKLQTGSDGRSPWLAGATWPFQVTSLTHPFRVPTSGGLEGMALSVDGGRLYPLLEKPLVGAEPNELMIFEFDLETRQFTRRTWRYPLEPEATAIGDFLMFSENRGLVIERDNAEGDLDAFKRIYEIELGEPGERVTKRLLVDLIQIADPHEISLPAHEGDVGLGPTFSLPFFTIECLALLDARHLLVAIDNNYPFSVGRHMGTEQPDDSEIIIIELPEPLFN